MKRRDNTGGEAEKADRRHQSSAEFHNMLGDQALERLCHVGGLVGDDLGP